MPDHLAFFWLDLPLDFCQVVVGGEGGIGGSEEGEKGVMVVGVFSEG